MSEPTPYDATAWSSPGYGAVPPAWYPTEWGWRWWDGAMWGPLAPGPASGTGAGGDEKPLALLSHLGAFLSVIVPLVVYLVTKHDKPFARHHAAEALNFQLTYLLVQFGSVIVFVLALAGAGGFSSGGTSDGIGVVGGIAVGLMAVVLFVVVIGFMALSIVGAIRASRMEWWRYPVNIRFVRP